VGVCLLLVLSLSAFSLSPGRGSSAPTRQPAAASSQTGVTPKTIKVGIALTNFDCIKQFVDSIRLKQEQVYGAYVADINAKGGINGRKIVPVYDTYCPLGSAGPLAVCTKFTDDDKVFAVIGSFVDFSGDAQTCVANQHKTVLMTFILTQQIIDKSPPGMIIFPGATAERTASVLLQLLNREKKLKGKKVAVLGGSQEANIVNKTIVPGLKKQKVPMGSTAILSINGTGDTTSAQAQLDSFIEKWKGQHVNAVFLSGEEVSSKQFVTKLRQEMPKVMLMTDNTDVRDSAQQEVHAGIKPNPYEGIMAAAGRTPAEYDKSANYKYCAQIYKKYTKKPAPKSTTVIKAPGGKTVDTYSSINDACQTMTMFHDIATKAGKNLTNASWVKAVDNYGEIVNRGTGPYSSLHTGKYDAEDTFRLEAFDSSIKPSGNWKALTPVENITGQ
jgi:ABC-type branched-subunit amino acid transport system substrate-binding protein